MSCQEQGVCGGLKHLLVSQNCVGWCRGLVAGRLAVRQCVESMDIY